MNCFISIYIRKSYLISSSKTIPINSSHRRGFLQSLTTLPDIQLNFGFHLQSEKYCEKLEFYF